VPITDTYLYNLAMKTCNYSRAMF